MPQLPSAVKVSTNVSESMAQPALFAPLDESISYVT